MSDESTIAQLTRNFSTHTDFIAALSERLERSPTDLDRSTGVDATWIASPLGPLLAVADNTALFLLEFFDRKGLSNELKRLQVKKGPIGVCSDRNIPESRPHPIAQIERELKDYFAGEGGVFSTPIGQLGSDFTRTVWQTLCTIPVGETRSYQSVATLLGRPTAVRAVARANGANQIAIAVPCHRLVGADGSLTGYGGGLWRKQWLLDHEKAMSVV